jgi:hypothetical protein
VQFYRNVLVHVPKRGDEAVFVCPVEFTQFGP